MSDMKLTDNETQFLSDLCHDYFINGYGWRDEISQTFVDHIADGINLPAKSVPGVMASLVKKGLMWSDGPGSSCGFTDAGRVLITKRKLWEK